MGDIQPGDVVVCVDTRGRKGPKNMVQLGLPAGLKKGGIYRVKSTHWSVSCGELGVKLFGVAHNERSMGVRAFRFRKLRPADPSFIEEIKRVSTPALGARTAVQEVLG